MCGRYTTNTEEELIEIKDIIHDISIRISDEERMYLNREVVPGSNVPIIINTSTNKILQFAKWGLPKWDNKGLIFNCKSETMNTSRFFAPFIQNRCLIPAKCYYEWRHLDKKNKEKYQIQKSDGNIFFIGIVDYDEEVPTFTIITKEANEKINFIHDRMPVIIDNNDVCDWLDGKLVIDSIVSKNNDDLIYQNI